MNQNDTAVATDPAQEDASFLLTPPPTAPALRVNKRSGRSEPVDLKKNIRAVQRCAAGLHAVAPIRVATRPLSRLDARPSPAPTHGGKGTRGAAPVSARGRRSLKQKKK